MREGISGIIIANEPALEVAEAINHIYNSVDEIIIIYQNKKEFQKLKLHLASSPAGFKTNKLYYAPALGLAELYKKYAESLCTYDNIVAFDTDERFNPYTLANLNELFEHYNELAYRIRRQDGKGTTWQYRLWQKGSLEWRGFVHEHPIIKTKKLDLNSDFLLYHYRNPKNHPDYNQLLRYQWKSPFISALKGMAIDLAVDKTFAPKRFLNNWQSQMKEWGRLSKDDKKIRERVTKEGITKVIGSDSQEGINKLIKEYDNRKATGTKLLMQILIDKCC